jgi:recombination DNA repair RAD52 pathway protein
VTIRENLDSNIPASAVSKRSQSGTELSYLETWYVIDRLNQVLGTENWSWDIDKLDPIPGDKMSFICHGVLTATVDGKETRKSGIGYGSDKSKYNVGEMASKEAESDALKRAAMKLGRSLGLALYDKSQEYVDEEVIKTATNKARVAVPKTSTPAAGKTSPENSKTNTGSDTKVLRQKIKSAFSVLEAQKKLDKQTFTTDYMAGWKVDEASDNQITIAIERLKLNFTELPL